MKKVYVNPLQEILDTHVTKVQDYLEEALKMMFSNYLESTSGVIHGLAPTIASGNLSVNLASGAILISGVYGELEAATSVLVSLPSAGTRTDMLVASYEEILDTYSSGYVLLDVVTRNEQIVSLPSRKFGAIKVEQLTNTTYATRPTNKIPLCEITLSSTQITSLTDYRQFSLIDRFKEGLELNFKGLFYGSM